ncbi:MAG: B12-binding domain-containing protein [Planctomycetaceae bacterium]
MKKLLTPKQVAQAIDVSESSLKRWCDQGLLTANRTAGGHRRLALHDVLQFLRKSGQKLVRPELFGLPSNTGQTWVVLERAREQVRSALIGGDEELCRRILFDLYLAGHSVLEICDHVIAGAFHQIGELWEHGETSIYRERLACEIGFKMLHELSTAIRTPPAEALVALGGTLESDPYRLPTSMIELVLREQGWHATSLGTRLPAATIAEAVLDSRPNLLWLSVSSIECVPTFLLEYAHLQKIVTETGTPVVVGGRALTSEIRRRMSYSAYCDTLRHLVKFAAAISSYVPRLNEDGCSSAPNRIS